MAKSPPVILCAGTLVQDLVMQVDTFPPPGTKGQASNYVMVAGGSAPNSAIAVARLGGQTRAAGPLGDDEISNWIISTLKDEKVDCGGVVQVPGKTASISLIFIDAEGEKMIATWRGANLGDARPKDPERMVADIDALLVENRFPDFVIPICKAAHARGIPVVVDGDKGAREDDPLWGLATHLIFSQEGLRGTTGSEDLGESLRRVAKYSDGFLAVTDGPNGVIWLENGTLRSMPAHTVKAVDSLGAGDTFHGAFTLAIAEGRDPIEAMRFGAAAAALKCTRFGGSTTAPRRAETDAWMAKHPLPATAFGSDK